jgi:hypothetical protein
VTSPAEEAQKSVRGMEENAIHAKYIELVIVLVLILYIIWTLNCSKFAEFKRVEREHAKEKQKLMKDKDAGKFVTSLLPEPTSVS